MQSLSFVDPFIACLHFAVLISWRTFYLEVRFVQNSTPAPKVPDFLRQNRAYVTLDCFPWSLLTLLWIERRDTGRSFVHSMPSLTHNKAIRAPKTWQVIAFTFAIIRNNGLEANPSQRLVQVSFACNFEDRHQRRAMSCSKQRGKSK